VAGRVGWTEVVWMRILASMTASIVASMVLYGMGMFSFVRILLYGAGLL
jgi:hypothetical protein